VTHFVRHHRFCGFCGFCGKLIPPYPPLSVSSACRTQWDTRFRLLRFRSPLLTESFGFLFLQVLRCFSSLGAPHCPMYSDSDTAQVFGFFKIVWVQWLFFSHCTHEKMGSWSDKCVPIQHHHTFITMAAIQTFKFYWGLWLWPYKVKEPVEIPTMALWARAFLEEFAENLLISSNSRHPP